MARNRKAVGNGSTRKQPPRSRPSPPADAAQSNDAGKCSSVAMSTNSKPKRNPRRSAKDRWEEQKLMTSTSSQLIDMDLVKVLASPQAWNCLEESEKQEILNLLPDNVHPNPHVSPDEPDAKIPPLPQSFLRYSNNWRDGVRHFQLDLQTGRYDPDWLHQAEEAMQQRASGKFDKFKEQEFEQFWGQKQKLDRSLAAGQSSQVKLQTLVEHGVVREGDVWKYSRAFFKGADRVLVEKEARIVEIDGARLTFAVPPGKRVFLSSAKSPSKESPAEVPETPQIADSNGVEAKEPSAATKETQLDTNETTEAGPSNKRKPEEDPKPQRNGCGRPRKSPRLENNSSNDQATPPSEGQEETQDHTAENDNCHSLEKTDLLPLVIEKYTTTSAADNADHTMEDASQPVTTEAPLPSPSASNSEEPDEVILRDITGLNLLGTKILVEDGRIHNVPNGNAWKEFRSYRNNQDMGSLWEIRHAWFIRNK